MNNPRIALISILISFAICRICLHAEAPVPALLTVATDGSADHTSIQAAIDAAPAGAVIRIAPGMYKENLTIEKSLTLLGAGWDHTTIAPENVITESYEQLSRKLKNQLKLAGTDQLRQMIKSQFRKKYASPTLTVNNAENVEIRNLKLTSFAVDGNGWSLAQAIVEFRHAKALLSECAVIGSQKDGIRVLDASHLETSDSLVAAVWGAGIVVSKKDGSAPRASILNSDIRNCRYAGIRIRPGCNSTIIKRCRISGAAWHGIRYDDASPTIADNLIFGNARCGVYASGKTAATITGNILYKNEIVGMWTLFQNRDTIRANTFASNGHAALAVSGASEPAVRHNIFFGHHRALRFSKLNEDSPYAKVEGKAQLENNLFWKNKTDAARCIDLLGIDWEDVVLAQETKTLVANPMFMNPEKMDFSLKPDSPARQKGLGAADPVSSQSLWELQPEEIAIIPSTTQTRDSSLWKKPGRDAPATVIPGILRESKPTAKVQPEQKEKLDTKTVENLRAIQGLIDARHKTKAILTHREHMLSSPDADKKLAEYKRKLEQIKGQTPPDVAKKQTQELEKLKKIHGDKWTHIYRQLRSGVRLQAMMEACDSDIEPFVRTMTMYAGNLIVVPFEQRNMIANSLGINPYTDPDGFWNAYKDYLRRFANSDGQHYLDQLVAKFQIPDAVLKYTRDEVRRTWYEYGYQYLIDLFSEEKTRPTKERLESIEQELLKYPDWEKIEKEMFQSAKAD